MPDDDAFTLVITEEQVDSGGISTVIGNDLFRLVLVEAEGLHRVKIMKARGSCVLSAFARSFMSLRISFSGTGAIEATKYPIEAQR